MRRGLGLAALLALGLAALRRRRHVSRRPGDQPRLVVFAAASLESPLSECAPAFRDADVTLRFGGSDALAERVGKGARADALAVADTGVPASLTDAGELEAPVEFAADRAATYVAGVVARTTQPEAAEAFVDDLLAGGCHDALLAAGFTEP